MPGHRTDGSHAPSLRWKQRLLSAPIVLQGVPLGGLYPARGRKGLPNPDLDRSVAAHTFTRHTFSPPKDWTCPFSKLFAIAANVFFRPSRCPRFPAARYLTQSTKALCRGILDGLVHLDSNCTDKKNPLLSVLFTRSVRKRLLRDSDPRCRFRPPRAERIRPFRPSVYLSIPSSSRTVGL